MKSFSIIIPTIGRFDSLKKLIQSIHRDGFYGTIIVVCDGCIAPDNFKAHYRNVIFINIAKAGAGVARNYASEITNTDWIYFVDDDCELPNGWLKIILNAINSAPPYTGMIGGDVLPQITSSWIGRYLSHIKHLSGPLYYGNKISCIATANMLVSRNAFRVIGGFDERLVEGSEDANLTWRMRSKFKVLYNYEIIVYHDHNISFRDFCKKFFRYGYSYSKHLAIIKKESVDDGVYFVISNINITTLYLSIYQLIKRPFGRIFKNKIIRLQYFRYYPLSFIQEFMFLAGSIYYCIKKDNKEYFRKL